MNFEIVQIVQELSTAGGVETVASELARILTRNGLPNVVLASAVSEGLERGLRLEPGRNAICRAVEADRCNEARGG
ncbi:hypothetical protein [Bradyrhizobium sp.]|uniref:hypothetical protein n=1 Tax=Bradyrhizobium sp. TaxID=376 RepID=UPI0026161DF3|nr:hypothetical protein [Bradyrhizobium sp.]